MMKQIMQELRSENRQYEMFFILTFLSKMVLEIEKNLLSVWLFDTKNS